MGRNVWHGKLRVVDGKENKKRKLLLQFHNVNRPTTTTTTNISGENVGWNFFHKNGFSFLFAFHLLATSSSTEASRQHQQLTVYFHSLNNLLSSTTKKKSLKEEKYFRQKYLGYSISEACVDKTCWCGWRFFWHIFGGRFGRWLSELFGGAATTCAPFSLRSNVI